MISLGAQTCVPNNTYAELHLRDLNLYKINERAFNGILSLKLRKKNKHKISLITINIIVYSYLIIQVIKQ